MSQFFLKWNSHVPNMLSVFENLKSVENFVDVTLACEGRLIKAHKLVLSAGSKFFHYIFLTNPCKHPVIVMNEVKYNILLTIIEFIYKGEINITRDNLPELLRTAKSLEIKGLATLAVEALSEICKESASSENFDSQENSNFSSLDSTSLPLDSSQHLHKKKRKNLQRKRSYDSTISNEEVVPKIEPASPESSEPVDFPPIKIAESCSVVVSNMSTPSSSGENLLNTDTNSVPLPTSKELDERDQVAEKEYQVQHFKMLEQGLTTEQIAPVVATHHTVESPKYHHLVAKRKPISPVWIHFGLPADENGYVIDKDISICRLCSDSVSSKGGSLSNLISHLKLHHSLVFKALFSKSGISDPPRSQFESSPIDKE